MVIQMLRHVHGVGSSEPYSLSYVNSEEGGQTQQRPRGSHGLLSILPTLLEI